MNKTASENQSEAKRKSDGRVKGPIALIILDGYAINPNLKANAVAAASKPNLDQLMAASPWTTLLTYGERVGLPDDQMGNSEVGHLNIGAGRVVEQELTRVNRLVRTRTLRENEELQRAFAMAQESNRNGENRALHVIGLTSTGGVHSSIDHIRAIVEAAAEAGVKRIYVHAITDGRDRPPTASIEELLPFEQSIKKIAEDYNVLVRIPSVIGRYYAMDRDKRWERTEEAFKLFTEATGATFSSVEEAIRSRHSEGETDEFIRPCWIRSESDTRRGAIENDDVVLFANFRADRMRQLVPALIHSSDSAASFLGFARPNQPRPSRIFTLTEYEEGLPVSILFPPFFVQEHLGWSLANGGLRQLRIAETEKYAHVTYFFNGGQELVLPGEERFMVPSPKDVPTYDLKPEMSAFGVTDELIRRLETNSTDVAIINFANCDMVGHTGVFDSAVKAVETVDLCVGRILRSMDALGGSAIITADHGNADQMIDYDTGEPHTFHTKNPVPFMLFGRALSELKLNEGGALCDIAPTMLELLGLPQPELMTGKSLIRG